MFDFWGGNSKCHSDFHNEEDGKRQEHPDQ